MSDRSRSEQLTEFEQRIAALKPAVPSIDRDQLMVNAGWAAAEVAAGHRSSARRWKMATFASTATALLLVIRLATLPMPQDDASPHVAATSSKQTGPSLRPQSNWNYLALRESVLNHGIDAWKQPPCEGDSFTATPATSRNLLRQFLGEADNLADRM